MSRAEPGTSPKTLRDFLRDARSRLRWRPPRLRFEPALEDHFWHATAASRLKHFVLSGTVALFIYNGFLAVDWIMAPDVFDLALLVRLGLFTPLGALVLLAGAFTPRLTQRMSPHVIEWVVILSGVMAAFSLSVILTSTSSPLAVLYRAGFVPALVYGNTVQRLRFRGAVVSSALMIGIYILSMHTARADPGDLVTLDWPMTLLIVAVAVYTLVSNYRMEYVERQRFLLSERALELGRQLKQTYQQLDAQARSDALTEVANRRHFDTYLSLCWSELQRSGGSLSLLLIDVDHFKAFNDRYGHPAGDECLRHVARALQSQVDDSTGLLARWGGEEFAVVLPHANERAAAALGAALRHAVQTANLRHEASLTAATVTVSIGVASVQPQACPLGAAHLVTMADAALYEAKHSGRNRVVAARAADLVSA